MLFAAKFTGRLNTLLNVPIKSSWYPSVSLVRPSACSRCLVAAEAGVNSSPPSLSSRVARRRSSAGKAHLYGDRSGHRSLRVSVVLEWSSHRGRHVQRIQYRRYGEQPGWFHLHRCRYQRGRNGDERALSLDREHAAGNHHSTSQPDDHRGPVCNIYSAATGTAPLSYQWYQGGVAIGGATASIYTTPATTSLNNTVYTVVVSNVAGAATSAAATLTMAPIAPTLSFGVIAGQTYGGAAFAVNATSASSGAVIYSVVSGPRRSPAIW